MNVNSSEPQPLKPHVQIISSLSLRYSVKEGVAASIMLGSGETYLSAYGIFLKALPLQVGVLAALPPLIGGFLQTLGVSLMERYRQRRRLITLGVVAQALLWFPIALLPFL